MPQLSLHGLFQANSVQLQSHLECLIAHYPVIPSHFPNLHIFRYFAYTFYEAFNLYCTVLCFSYFFPVKRLCNNAHWDKRYITKKLIEL